LDELDIIDKKIKTLTNQIAKGYKKITKPFFDHQVLRKVRIVPEVVGKYYTWQGYKCFYDAKKSLNDYTYNDLVHIWVWKKHNKRNPKPGYHIHHKDREKLNNHISNLEEIHRDDHKKKHQYKKI